MIVWFTSGQSLTAWIRPILMFATPLVVIIGVLSLGLSPWAEEKTQQYRAHPRSAQRGDRACARPLQGSAAIGAHLFHRELRSAVEPDQQRVHPVGRERTGRSSPPRCPATSTTMPVGRALPRAAEGPPLRRRAGQRRLPRSSTSRSSAATSRPAPCAATSRRSKSTPTPDLLQTPEPAIDGGAVLADRRAGDGDAAGADGDPAVVRQSADRTLVQPDGRDPRLRDLLQLDQLRAGESRRRARSACRSRCCSRTG